MAQKRKKSDGRALKCKPDDAWQMYLALSGPSVPELRQALLQKFGDDETPAIKTLYSWSSEHKWRERLGKLETLTDDEVEKMIVKDKAAYRARQIGLLMTVSEKAVSRVAQTLATADEVFNQSIRNAADLQRLINLADTAGKHAELLDGRATGRHDSRPLQEDQDDEVLVNRAQRVFGRKKRDEDVGSGVAGDESGPSTPPGSDQLH